MKNAIGLCASLLGLFTLSARAQGVPSAGTTAAADWESIPLDKTGKSLGHARQAFNNSMVAPERMHQVDNCMIAWVLGAPDHAPERVLNGTLELRVEAEAQVAVVRRSSMIDSDSGDPVIDKCLARVFEGPLALSLEPGTRLRLSYPVRFLRHTIGFYRNKYPPRSKPAASP